MAILQATGVTGSLSISSSRIPRSTSASLFSVNGYNGRLINVVDSLSGSLFSVNSVAGLPIFEVFSNNKVVAGKYNANDFVISGSRVGIGTTSPSFKLDVSGEAYISTRVISDRFASITNGNNNSILFSSNTTSLINNGSTALYINSSGNVGIGTTNPTSKTYILDSADSPALGTLRVRSTGGNSSICIDSNSTSQYSYFTLAQNGAGKFEMGIIPTTSDFYLNANTQVGATNAAIFIKKSDSNIGIGTTTPVGKFDIRPDSNWLGAEAFIVDTDGGNNPRIRLYRPGGGDATTAYPIHLRNDSGNLNILTGNAAALGSETVSSKFYLKADGNLGIGTTSPAAKLNVVGTSLFSDFVAVSKDVTLGPSTSAAFGGYSAHPAAGPASFLEIIESLSNAIGVNDPLRFRSVTGPQKFSGGSWSTDASPPTYANLLDGNATSHVNIITAADYSGGITARRFTVVFGPYTRPNFITIQSDYGVNNFWGYSVFIEKSTDNVTFTTACSTITVSNNTAPLLAFSLGDLSDTAYLRFTFTSTQQPTSGGALKINRIRSYGNQFYSSSIPVYTNSSGNLFSTTATYLASSSGNVGIGTTTATQKLDVNTGTLTAGFGAKIGEARIGTWIGGTTYAFFAHQNVADTSTSYSLLQGSDGTTFLNAASARNLYFRIANNDAMIIDSNRNFIVGNTTIGSYSGTTPIFTTWSTGVTNSDTDGGSVVLWSTSTFAQNMGSALSFGCKYNTAGNYATLARIRGAKENSTDGNYSGYFAIDTRTSGGNFSEKVRVQNDGNVGIGTVTPDVKLHLSGTGNQELKIQTNTSGNPILSLVAAGQDSAQIIYNRTGNYLGINISSVTNAIVLNTSGNVGIGAIVPAARLHLSSSSTTALRIETKVGSGADSEIEFVGPDTHSYAMGIDESDNDKFKISYAASRTPPTLGTNDRFIIQTDGNIGINTTVASSKFHVVNDAVSNANQPGINGLFAGSVDGRNLLRVQNTDPNVSAAALGSGISLQAYSKNSNQPATNTHEAQLLLLANNNSLGGTTVLVAPVDFQVNVSASNVNMGGTNYSNYGSFSTYFKRDGNVGVGTFNPSYKLDVSGSSVWSTTTRIDARIGNAAIGRHPYWGDYAYFSHAALDNTVQNNYLILQYKDGSAYFNAPLNKSFYFVNNGSTYVATVNATGIAIGKGTGGANYTLDVTGSATISGKLGVGGSPGTGKVYVNAGGSSNPFLTVANALGTADTTTAGYTARGFIAIDLGAGVVTGRTGTHYIQVFSKP